MSLINESWTVRWSLVEKNVRRASRPPCSRHNERPTSYERDRISFLWIIAVNRHPSQSSIRSMAGQFSNALWIPEPDFGYWSFFSNLLYRESIWEIHGTDDLVTTVEMKIRIGTLIRESQCTRTWTRSFSNTAVGISGTPGELTPLPAN